MLGKIKRHKISREEKRAILAEFTLMDDIFMRVVLQDIKCTEYIYGEKNQSERTALTNGLKEFARSLSSFRLSMRR